ncbi:MAG: ribose 5-phosphate isomerase B [Candidatus Caenarcaniphilales bacterium]|nr:ribose 5-phosphate isomerase B [Candidatus Caenarcaniphilales bacterium]
MKIGIASDHAGFALKEHLVIYLKNNLVKNLDLEVVDYGCNSATESVDYPDFAKKIGDAILTNQIEKGILVCGSGVGMSIAANRIKGIRAALLSDLLSARLCREHNDSNVACFGSWIVSPKMAEEILCVWLSVNFGSGRHQRRVDKLDE